MEWHRYILCMGSNTNAEKNLLLGRSRLEILEDVGDVIYAPEEWTEAVGYKINPAPFLNQVVKVTSSRPMEWVKSQLKTAEHDAGRTSEEKASEIIRLDIDILSVDERVLKPKDWERDYVQRGIDYIRQVESKKYQQ